MSNHLAVQSHFKDGDKVQPSLNTLGMREPSTLRFTQDNSRSNSPSGAVSFRVDDFTVEANDAEKVEKVEKIATSRPMSVMTSLSSRGSSNIDLGGNGVVSSQMERITGEVNSAKGVDGQSSSAPRNTNGAKSISSSEWGSQHLSPEAASMPSKRSMLSGKLSPRNPQKWSELEVLDVRESAVRKAETGKGLRGLYNYFFLTSKEFWPGGLFC